MAESEETNVALRSRSREPHGIAAGRRAISLDTDCVYTRFNRAERFGSSRLKSALDR